MKALFAFLFLTTQIHRADAITWEFDTTGDTQGWTARESSYSQAIGNTLAHLRSEVSAGVWRIDVAPFEYGRNPSLQLVSPFIGQDSGLFDRVEVRLRVVHTAPFFGSSSLHWTNEHNQLTPGWESREQREQNTFFWIFQWHIYTTDWQEIMYAHLETGTFELPAGGRIRDIVWEGALDDIRIDLGLYPLDPENVSTAAVGTGNNLVKSPAEVPVAVEVDWIRLTGVEELLEGELPPPAETLTPSLGGLFNAPTFHPLEVRPDTRSAPFPGDVDGDGTIDLVAKWATRNTEGWLVAFGDGAGGFSPGYVETVPTLRFTNIIGGDINRDGLLDLVVENGVSFEVLVNYGAEGFVVEEELSSFLSDHKTFFLFALADINGDSYEDMWVGVNFGYDDADLLVLLNDGTGQFGSPSSLSLRPQMRLQPSWFIEAIGANQGPGMLWDPPYDEPGAGYKTTHLNAGGELEVRSLPIRMDSAERSGLLRYVGDFDRDGDVDWARSDVEIIGNNKLGKGLILGINTDDGSLDEMRLHQDVFLIGKVLSRDLNGDGRLDLVFVNSDFRHPGVVVHLGQEEGPPLQEGYYPLSGPGGSLATGDLDGDGDIDIVVLESAVIGSGGGIHVLLNTSDEEATAITNMIGDSQPVSFALGANYPNPFNPATTIPVSVAAGAGDVDLTIYNVLGQPVRQVWNGPLAAGEHRLAWDGRDGQGRSVAAGVYVVRLLQGEQMRLHKMVKLD
ncbi:MAG: T9SS type A sorting domain-containing protein [Dehalococcoidia bacterium]|nr:T9SS type A sorting domain-containing protein [Dehalococcoidia bacterium]